jgi:hypothetical protein
VKILFVIASNLFVRNYLKTNALSCLDANSLYFLASKDVTVRGDLEKKRNFLGYFDFNSEALAWHWRLLDVMMWRYRKRSGAFFFRFYRLRIYLPLATPMRRLRMVKRFLAQLKLFLIGSKLLSGITIPWIGKKATINRSLLEKIKQVHPDIVIFPSSAYDPIGLDLIRISKEIGFRTLFLVDNWDNLSSKSVFWKLPDFLAVWGEQSKLHATNIQEMPAERVFIIGTPRFQKYYDIEFVKERSRFNFPYILFCGCNLPFDELSTLKQLDYIVSKHSDVFKNTKILYRPHPWRAPRECFDLFNKLDFKKVEIDPQVADAYYRKGNSKEFLPDLNYYPILLKNALFVVGPLTTMLIESLICGKEVLALAYDDGVHISSPHNAYRYYPHFRGIDRIKGLFLCEKIKEIEGDILGMMMREEKTDLFEIRKSLQYFVFNDSESYANRLKQIVDGIGAKFGQYCL